MSNKQNTEASRREGCEASELSGLVMPHTASELLLQSARPFDKACMLVKEMEEKIIQDKYAVDLANSERDDRTRAAARLANALKDINNLIGEMPEVRDAVSRVEMDIEHYAGLEDVGA